MSMTAQLIFMMREFVRSEEVRLQQRAVDIEVNQFIPTTSKRGIPMIIGSISPRDDADLVRVFQRMMTEDVRIYEPYCPTMIDAIKEDADEMAKEPGNVTVILVRS